MSDCVTVVYKITGDKTHDFWNNPPDGYKVSAMSNDHEMSRLCLIEAEAQKEGLLHVDVLEEFMAADVGDSKNLDDLYERNGW